MFNINFKALAARSMIGALIAIGAYQTAVAVTPGGFGLNPDYIMSFIVSGAGYVVIAWAVHWLITEFQLTLTGMLSAVALIAVCAVITYAEGFALAKFNADQTAATVADDQNAIDLKASLLRKASSARANITDLKNRVRKLDGQIAMHAKRRDELFEQGFKRSLKVDSAATRQIKIDELELAKAKLQDQIITERKAASEHETRAAEIDTTGKSAFIQAAGGGDAAEGVATAGWVRAMFNVLVIIALEALAAGSARKSLNSLVPHGNYSEFARNRAAMFRTDREQIEFIAGELLGNRVPENPDPSARSPFSQSYVGSIFGVRKPKAGLAMDLAHQRGWSRITVDGQGEHHHRPDDLQTGFAFEDFEDDANVTDARDLFSGGRA